jgi:hypothetical protein
MNSAGHIADMDVLPEHVIADRYDLSWYDLSCHGSWQAVEQSPVRRQDDISTERYRQDDTSTERYRQCNMLRLRQDVTKMLLCLSVCDERQYC